MEKLFASRSQGGDQGPGLHAFVFEAPNLSSTIFDHLILPLSCAQAAKSCTQMHPKSLVKKHFIKSSENASDRFSPPSFLFINHHRPCGGQRDLLMNNCTIEFKCKLPRRDLWLRCSIKVTASVTRCLADAFNIWPFSTTKICPIA